MLDDLYHLRERARAALNRGDLDDAANSLVSAAQQTHVAEHDYLSVLRPLVEVLARRNDSRSALTVHWYMAFSEPDGWKRALRKPKRLERCDRTLWTALRELTIESVTTGVDRTLTKDEIRAVIARRDLIVKQFARMIETSGEPAILFSVTPRQ